MAVGTADGVIEWRVAGATRAERGRDAVLRDLFSAVDDALSVASEKGGMAGIAIGVAGPVDARSGMLQNPPNLPGWTSVPVARLFEERYGIASVVANDANLAALGEHRYGAGRGSLDMIYITVSTGIGGGVIAGGRLLLGHCGFAGEIGHMSVDMQGPACACGNVGCLEVLASGTAIARRAREALSSGGESILGQLPPERVTAEAVAEAARAGDALSQRLLAEAGATLGIGLVNLAHLFNPQRVIIGGGVSNAGDHLWTPMVETVRRRGMTACHREMEILRAALGDDAGLMGGIALVAMQRERSRSR